MKNIENLLFTEKYRPKTLEDLIVPQRIREKFEKGVNTNLLLAGSAGIGKCLGYDEELEIYMDESTYKKYFEN